MSFSASTAMAPQSTAHCPSPAPAPLDHTETGRAESRQEPPVIANLPLSNATGTTAAADVQSSGSSLPDGWHEVYPGPLLGTAEIGHSFAR
jgi:hypothetical protein